MQAAGGSGESSENGSTTEVTSHAADKKRRGLRVLLVEDLEVSREMMTKILKQHGHAVVAARDGREAVAAFERQAFDVVLMDVQMEGMNGVEATQIIREKEKATGGHTRIVAMTAHESEAIQQHLLEAGMDAHMAKPCDIDRLLEVLEGSSATFSTSTATSAARLVSGAGGAEAGKESFEETLRFEETLLRRAGGDRKLLIGSIRLFQAEYPKKIKEARKAMATRDGQALAETAHAVKGLAGNFDAGETRDAAKRLEASGHSSDFAGAKAALAALEKEIAALEQRLKAVASGGGRNSGAKKSRRVPGGRK
jgi:CheY-like chemotaxis protein